MKIVSRLACSLLAVLLLPAAPPLPANEIPDEARLGGFAVACQAYSFNRFSLFEAIGKTTRAGSRLIELYPGQKLSGEEPHLRLDENAPDEVLEKALARMREAGVRPVAYGLVTLRNDEAACRKAFELARKLGLHALAAVPEPDAMDLIERLAVEYDIRVGIHNGPRRATDPAYQQWDPSYVLGLVQNRDARLGACADIGHWMRSGIRPVEALRLLEGRIISCHIKDLNGYAPAAHEVPFGTGQAGIGEILAELRRQNFRGNLTVEYNHNWHHNVTDVALCIGFIRGWDAASPRPEEAARR